jgi:hypothetical protein
MKQSSYDGQGDMLEALTPFRRAPEKLKKVFRRNAMLFKDKGRAADEAIQFFNDIGIDKRIVDALRRV